MKTKSKKGVCILLLLCSMLGYSQESPETKKALLKARLQLLQDSKTYNPQGGIATYKQLADLGNAEAMNALGLIYNNGISVPVNEQQGIQWLE